MSAKFSPLVTIDLTRIGLVEYPLEGCNRLWLPKLVAVNGVVITNPLDCVIGIQVNDRNGGQHPWAIKDGYMNTLSGAIERIFVQVLTKGAGSLLYLGTGDGVQANYGSSDGLSPVVGGSYTPPAAPPPNRLGHK